MSGRSYLSIGDVLSLLREEFPDVTISKIRFLESQGLVNPERSPSGYRKFYDTDVERLRWVLRQQREHFLPLKVIRDRLSADGADVREPEEDVAETDAPEAGLLAVPDHNGPDRNRLDRNGKEEPAEPAAESNVFSIVREPEPAMASTPSMATSAHSAPTSSQRREGEGDGALPGLAFPASLVKSPTTSSAVPPETPPTPAASPTNAPGSGTPATVGGSTSPERAPAPPLRPAPGSAPAARAMPAASGPAAPTPTPTSSSAGSKGSSGEREQKFSVSSGVSGASLSLEELCAATGLQPIDIATLEGFSLIEPMEVAGIHYYDEEALTVAKLASEFSKFGIEARHLKLYRNAVDREVGLIEQIITPLLRQRNPEARQRAVDASVELAKLGQGIRASLLRKELRHQLGG